MSVKSMVVLSVFALFVIIVLVWMTVVWAMDSPQKFSHFIHDELPLLLIIALVPLSIGLAYALGII